MNNLISRQAAIDAIRKEYGGIKNTNMDGDFLADEIEFILSQLPSAQLEPTGDAEFWRKRADYYSDMCMNLIGEMGRGVKIKSVKINENGIEFIKEQSSAQPKDYTKLKREFILMVSYINVLLECSDIQKETLIGFISRLEEFMPWNEKD